MSKIYDIYTNLKSNDSDTNALYLFKSGMFFILVGDDAIIANKLLGLRLSSFSSESFKCGFPSNSLERYTSLISNSQYHFKVINSNQCIAYTIKEYCIDTNILQLLNAICQINTDELSIKETYTCISRLQTIAKEILEAHNE